MCIHADWIGIFCLIWAKTLKIGTLKNNQGPNWDPKSKKGPYRDPVPEIGTLFWTLETQRDEGSQAVCIHIGRVKHILALECDVTRGKLSGLAACPRAAQSASTWRRLLFLTPTRPPSQTFDTFYIFRQSDPIPGSIWIKQETMNHKEAGTSRNRLHVLVWKSQSLLNSG